MSLSRIFDGLAPPRLDGAAAALAALLALAPPAEGAGEKFFSAGMPTGAVQRVVLEHADECSMEYDTGWIDARGRVVIRYGDQELRARSVRANMRTEDAVARGSVELRRPGGDLRGSWLRGNFKTGIWEGGDFAGDAKPFRLLRAEKVTRDAQNEFQMEPADVTTCTNAAGHVHFHVKADRVTLVPGDYLTARGAVWYFGSVPVMYLPYWYRDLKDSLGYSLRPGYSSRMGAFLLNSYSYRLSPEWKGESHLDLRSRRGVAVGQDVKWEDKNEGWRGDVELYYADDLKPVDEDEDPETANIERQRYRIRLSHGYAAGERDYVLVRGQYLSDTDIREDFFEREYRRSPQPENFAVFTHRGGRYVGNLLLRGRLNDFYEDVNRVPEASIQFVRQSIGDSGLYYEGQTAAAYLEKVWSDSNTNAADYSSGRMDSEHMVYYPGQYMGFVSLIPRAGYRLTYYSETKDTVVAGSGTNAVTWEGDGGPGVRSRAELGCEASYRAFKTWRGGWISPLRHVAEPYCNYTLAPRPNLEPEDLHYFDAVDSLGLDHSLKVGIRNTWQVKWDGKPIDLIDLNTYTRIRVERDHAQRTLDDLSFDVEIVPGPSVVLDADGALDTEDGFVRTLNCRATVRDGGFWRAGGEYRYKRGESSLLYGDVTFLPGRNWEFQMYGRHQFEEQRLEEIAGYVQRNLDCMEIRGGVGFLPGYEKSDGTQQNDEWKIMIEFWLTAFPEVRVSAR